MMKIENIKENSNYKLENKFIPLVKKILFKNPDLPIKLKENYLIFNDYTIGEFRIDDLIIKIEPRNKSFTLESFFQILQFIDQPLLDDLSIPGFKETDNVFDIKSLISSYYDVLEKLIQYGFTGSFDENINKSQDINGEIIFDEFIPPLFPYEGITIKNIQYSNDTKANQILKTALNKLIVIENSSQNLRKFQILRDFDFIVDQNFQKEDIENIIENFYTSNPYYFLALNLAKIILFSLKLEYRDGNIEWASFLENSNDIFEKYIFRILKNNLKEKIEKWENPRQFATLNSLSKIGYKSFSPDIIINYNKGLNSAGSVLDVKNKVFEPNNENLSNLVSSSDLYQLIFYCKQLKVNVGGLVFPSSISYDPIKVDLETSEELSIYLFSINMNVSLKKRNKKLSEEIYEFIIKKI